MQAFQCRQEILTCLHDAPRRDTPEETDFLGGSIVQLLEIGSLLFLGSIQRNRVL